MVLVVVLQITALDRLLGSRCRSGVTPAQSLAHKFGSGWETSVSTYKNKIYLLVQKMFGLVDKVLPSNRRIVDDYLSHFSFWRIDLLLRSTHSTSHSGQTDHELVRVTEAYTAAEEERLSRNLESVAFEIDTSATVALITGPGRIERVSIRCAPPVVLDC